MAASHPEGVADSALCAENIRIVLVEPSHPGNIGGVARAMKTMGFADLALVNPKRFPDPQAQWRAAAAADVLDSARVFDQLEHAIADCGIVAGTSARQRRIPLPLTTAADLPAWLANRGTGGRPVAILFGREASGLDNEELLRCNLHVAIDSHPGYPSLNLAMAVQIVCYELHKALADKPAALVEQQWDRPLATAAQLDGLYAHLERLLIDIGFHKPQAPRKTLARLRRLLARVGADETEVAILRGALTHIERTLAKADDDRGSGTGSS